MGIPRFVGEWLKPRGFVDVIRTGLPNEISSLLVDANGLLHKAAQMTFHYGEYKNIELQQMLKNVSKPELEARYFIQLETLLTNLLSAVRPRLNFVLAVDGVAPMAKMQQQRQRRYKSAKDSASGVLFDSNNITPGTDFMMKVDNAIKFYLKSRQNDLLPPKVIYSNHMVPGEGEHKIMDLIRQGHITGEGAHIVYGLDADLVMLSLMAPLDHIILMREDIADTISIRNMRRQLVAELGSIDDFILMMFLMGNDFLPHSPSLDDMAPSIELLITARKVLNKPLIQGKEINWENMGLFLNILAQKEPELMNKISQKTFTYPSRMIESSTTEIVNPNGTVRRELDYELFREYWYMNEFMPKVDENDAARTIMRMLGEDISTEVEAEQISDMCQQYILGLSWVYLYYKEGLSAVNFNYQYTYYHSPLFLDLAIIAYQAKDTGVQGYRVGPHDVVFNPVQQLLTVLPPKSIDLIPPEVQDLVTDWDSPIFDIYPEDFLIELDGKNFAWQGIALLPIVEPDRIMDAVDWSEWAENRRKLYEPGVNEVLLQKAELSELLEEKRRAQEALQRIVKKEQKPGRQYQQQGPFQSQSQASFQQQPYGGGRGGGRGRGERGGSRGSRGGGYRGGERGRGGSRGRGQSSQQSWSQKAPLI